MIAVVHTYVEDQVDQCPIQFSSKQICATKLVTIKEPVFVCLFVGRPDRYCSGPSAAYAPHQQITWVHISGAPRLYFLGMYGCTVAYKRS